MPSNKKKSKLTFPPKATELATNDTFEKIQPVMTSVR